ncbi:MAG: thiazole synthase, partial [Planctomycetota bacterium]
MPVDSPIAPAAEASLRIGSHTLASRLIVGTGKYATYAQMAECLDASGTD